MVSAVRKRDTARGSVRCLFKVRGVRRREQRQKNRARSRSAGTGLAASRGASVGSIKGMAEKKSELAALPKKAGLAGLAGELRKPF